MNAAEIMKRLRVRFAPPEYALLANVANAIGGATTRRADAIAMGLWPSRGLDLHGFEIKVSRGDWLAERKNPGKADEIARYCDRWWLVVSDEAIVKLGELPETWGLLVASGKGLCTRKEAPKLEPLPMTRYFLAALMRVNHKTSLTEQEIHRIRAEGHEAGMKLANESTERELARVQRELDALTASVKAFAEASGVTIDRYDGGDIGKAVAMVRNAESVHNRVRSLLEGDRMGLLRVVDAVDAMLARLDAKSPDAEASG